MAMKDNDGLMIIRPATIYDISSILDIITQSYQPYKNEIPPDGGFDISDEALNRLIEGNDSMVFIAVKDDCLVGVASGINHEPNIYHLKLLFVSMTFQHQGIASDLLQRFEDIGKEKGCRLFTSNYQIWAPWSRAFYYKNGYREYKDGDETECTLLKPSVEFRKKIGKLNNDYKCFIWKNA